MVKAALLALVAALYVAEISGHGMMMDPINRSSAWRKGFPVPPNYSDNEHFCGGFAVQWQSNGGKCGECGDNYVFPRPRPNENGGLYGTGLIVKHYQSGEAVNITVRITANHWGTFKFDICDLEGVKDGLETDECFAKYPLKLVDGSDTYTLPSHETKDYYVDVQLPKGLKCLHCVLRWTYRAANSWGICEDGKGKLGCGNQEHFRSCSDISIV